MEVIRMAKISGFGWYEKIGREKIEFATDTEAREYGGEVCEDDDTHGNTCNNSHRGNHKK